MSYTPPNPNGQATMANSSPVVIASDQSAVSVSNAGLTALNGAIAGTEVQVDVVGALPAGTNNIGDVDVLSVPAPLSTAGNGTAATALRVTVASDSTGVVGLAAGANTIGNIGTIGTSVTPGTAAANLGKAEDAVHSTGDTGVMALAVRTDTAASLSGTTGDYNPLQTDSLGRLWISGAAVEDAAETAGGILLMAGSVRRDTAASSAGTTGDNATINTDSVGALWTRDTATQVDDAAFTPATGRVMPIALLADETATDSVDEGDAGIARMTLDRKQIVTPYAHTAGGATPYKLNSAASTNATSVKASAGQIYTIVCMNTNADERYLKIYNKASAPTVGTDTPVQVYTIPGNAAGAGFTITFPVGMTLGTGIAFAITTGAADSDTGAVAANEIIVNLTYA